MSLFLPRVSILLPVRNGMPWLPAALEGLWRQTFADFEVLAVEDGSTDATAAELARQTDRRLRVLPTGGVGLAKALNHGLAHARGALVARHDADDLSHPERLARQVAFLDAHREIDVLATAADYIGPDGEPVDDDWVRTVRRRQDVATTPEQIARLLPVTCCITHGSVMTRMAVLRGAGGYRDEFVPADDYDLWLRLLASPPVRQAAGTALSLPAAPRPAGRHEPRPADPECDQGQAGMAAPRGAGLAAPVRGWRRPGPNEATAGTPRWPRTPASSRCVKTRTGTCWR